jgi:hypothetical protein
VAIAILGLAWLFALSAGPAVAKTRILDYRVSIAFFGDIGTYQNRIETSGNTTTVRSTLRCRVEFLGIVLHREDATGSSAGPTAASSISTAPQSQTATRCTFMAKRAATALR